MQQTTNAKTLLQIAFNVKAATKNLKNIAYLSEVIIPEIIETFEEAGLKGFSMQKSIKDDKNAYIYVKCDGYATRSEDKNLLIIHSDIQEDTKNHDLIFTICSEHDKDWVFNDAPSSEPQGVFTHDGYHSYNRIIGGNPSRVSPSSMRRVKFCGTKEQASAGILYLLTEMMHKQDRLQLLKYLTYEEASRVSEQEENENKQNSPDIDDGEGIEFVTFDENIHSPSNSGF